MSTEKEQRTFPTTTDTITLVLTGIATLIVIALLFYTQPSQAAGITWCGDWKIGYAEGYCWAVRKCEYVPNVTCPDPKPNQSDGYMAGLNAGLSDRKK